MKQTPIPGLDLGRMTRAERLHNVLADGAWHTTDELVRRVGHTFAVAKYHLLRQAEDLTIEKERDRSTGRFRYRLVKD